MSFIALFSLLQNQKYIHVKVVVQIPQIISMSSFSVDPTNDIHVKF